EPTRSAAARWSAGRRVGHRLHVAKLNLVLRADTLRQIRWRRAVERHVVEVVLVRRDEALAVRGVPTNPIRRLRPRMIVLRVDEAYIRPAAQRLRRSGVEVVRLKL